MASQCELPSVWGSALTMIVRDLESECGRISEGKTSRKEFSSRSVQNICMVSISLKILT